MSETFVYLRHTVSGVTSSVSADEAAHLLTNPHFKQYYEIVKSEKDAPLNRPYKLNEDGERVTLVEEKPVANDSPEPPIQSVDDIPVENSEDKK